MKKGKDTSAEFSGLYLVHQNIPGKKTSKVLYPEHILFIPLSGELTVFCGKMHFSIGPGHMLYVPPNTPHDFSSSEHAGERLIVLLKGPQLLTSTVAPIKLPTNQLAKEILFYLLVHPKTKSAKALTQVFSETLAEVLESSTTSEGTEHLMSKIQDPRIKKAVGILESRLSENISVAEIAASSGLSSRNFTRLLQQETGLAPKQWLMALRVEEAKRLLQTGQSVTEVAMAVGYSSLSQFISAFRARTGQLPSKFVQPG
jgi:AraC-like DNA-binding protein